MSITVPDDMWVCDRCEGGNLVKLAEDKCPVCEHDRANCCSGPGEQYPKDTGLSNDDPDFGYSSTYARGVSHSHASYNGHSSAFPNGSHAHHAGAAPSMNTAGYNDTWTCNECGALNQDWYDQCPVCNLGTKTAMMSQHVSQNASHHHISHSTFAGAGAPAPGSWMCPVCGNANSSLTPDFCPVCGTQF